MEELQSDETESSLSINHQAPRADLLISEKSQEWAGVRTAVGNSEA